MLIENDPVVLYTHRFLSVGTAITYMELLTCVFQGTFTSKYFLLPCCVDITFALAFFIWSIHKATPPLWLHVTHLWLFIGILVTVITFASWGPLYRIQTIAIWILCRITESEWVNDSPHHALKAFECNLLEVGFSDVDIVRLFDKAVFLSNDRVLQNNLVLNSKQEGELIRALAYMYAENEQQCNMKNRWLLCIVEHLHPNVWDWNELRTYRTTISKQPLRFPDFLWAALHTGNSGVCFNNNKMGNSESSDRGVVSKPLGKRWVVANEAYQRLQHQYEMQVAALKDSQRLAEAARQTLLLQQQKNAELIRQLPRDEKNMLVISKLEELNTRAAKAARFESVYVKQR